MNKLILKFKFIVCLTFCFSLLTSFAFAGSDLDRALANNENVKEISLPVTSDYDLDLYPVQIQTPSKALFYEKAGDKCPFINKKISFYQKALDCFGVVHIGTENKDYDRIFDKWMYARAEKTEEEEREQFRKEQQESEWRMWENLRNTNK